MFRISLKVSQSFALLAALACLSPGLCVPALAQDRSVPKGYIFQTLHSFTGGADGAYPSAGLIIDGAGNLYGTTEGNSVGTLFKYSLSANLFTTLQGFAGSEAVLVMDSYGNLYGVTTDGGGSNVNVWGTLFQYALATNLFDALYTFTGGADGGHPSAGLILDSSGNLYGTTANGGVNGEGTVFEYSPATNAFTTLHSFAGGAEGTFPSAGLIMDSAGNLYGTTPYGGLNDNGTIFEYSPATNAFTTLYSFSAATGYLNGVLSYPKNGDGANPFTGVIMDSGGNLYGTATFGGVNGSGTVFKYAPAANAFTTLYTFSAENDYGENSDGAFPGAGLVMDNSGALYGTASAGGVQMNGLGTIFVLRPIDIAVPPPGLRHSQGPASPTHPGGVATAP